MQLITAGAGRVRGGCGAGTGSKFLIHRFYFSTGFFTFASHLFLITQ